MFSNKKGTIYKKRKKPLPSPSKREEMVWGYDFSGYSSLPRL